VVQEGRVENLLLIIAVVHLLVEDHPVTCQQMFLFKLSRLTILIVAYLEIQMVGIMYSLIMQGGVEGWQGNRARFYQVHHIQIKHMVLEVMEVLEIQVIQVMVSMVRLALLVIVAQYLFGFIKINIPLGG
jgi:hypothetical protein